MVIDVRVPLSSSGSLSAIVFTLIHLIMECKICSQTLLIRNDLDSSAPNSANNKKLIEIHVDCDTVGKAVSRSL